MVGLEFGFIYIGGRTIEYRGSEVRSARARGAVGRRQFGTRQEQKKHVKVVPVGMWDSATPQPASWCTFEPANHNVAPYKLNIRRKNYCANVPVREKILVKY